jgi:hypothetical protein
MMVQPNLPKFARAFLMLVPSWRANADAMRANDRRPVITFLLKQAK